MSKFFLKQFYKKKFKQKDYNITNLFILTSILGNLTKNGHKGLSYSFLNNILLFLKRGTKQQPFLELRFRLSLIRPEILLLNKRRGTVVYELPRILSYEQSLRKSTEWLIKFLKKRKKNTLDTILKELSRITRKRGDILKKRKHISSIAVKNIPFLYILKKKKKRKS
jgi:ribosomal protein S7